MSLSTATGQSGVLRLDGPRQLPSFLGLFFRRALSRPFAVVELGDGLWHLLHWCWGLNGAARAESGLCRVLIAGPSDVWLDEADVLEAMARRSAGLNPAMLHPADVEPFVQALLEDGEKARGSASRLDVRLEFALPAFSASTHCAVGEIEAALRETGLSEHLIREHAQAVHPERRPYCCAWVLSLRTVGSEHRAEASLPPESSTIPVLFRDDAVGRASRLVAWLDHAPEIGGYVRLSLTRILAATGSAREVL